MHLVVHLNFPLWDRILVDRFDIIVVQRNSLILTRFLFWLGLVGN